MTVHSDEISKQHESGIIARFQAVYNNIGRWFAGCVSLQFLVRSRSIAAMFVCENRSGLRNLVELYVFGKLQPILEELFTGLLVADYPQETAHIKKLVWELSDYCRCFLYFNPLPKREFISDPITCSLFLYTEHCSYMKMLR